jgi:hypothetical protein
MGMRHLGNMIEIGRDEMLLLALDARDLERLLELPAAERIGRIVALNRTARYANRLQAFALLERLDKIEAGKDDPSMGG